MSKNDFWWYVIPFCLGVISLTLTLYSVHKRISEQAVEEPVNVIKTVDTEHNETKVPVGKIECVDADTNNRFCRKYVIYRTLVE